MALALACALPAAPALAQTGAAGDQAEIEALADDTAPSARELAALAAELASADAERRRAAFESLATLADDALPVVRTRLRELAKRGFDLEGALGAMTEFRRVQGVSAPDGEVDLAKGVLPVLARQRTPGVLAAAELVGLLRALEAQKSPAAADLIVGQLFALDAGLFRYEAPRTQARLSALIIPALIRHQSHPKPWVRSYCHDALVAMKVDSPGRAVQQDDVGLLAAILGAYGETLSFDAMPVVVSYVTDERAEVRRAARQAVARFGRNAIWQVRERYLNATGKEPDPGWSYQRTLDELYRVHDEPKRVAFEQALAEATQALDEGAHEHAERALSRALIAGSDDPGHADVKRAAPLYAQLGEHALRGDRLEQALGFYRRALRLDSASPARRSHEARVAYLEAELRLTQGIVDLEAYQRAATLDASFEPAREALDELTGERAAREGRLRRAIGLVAALLMTIGGFVLLRRPRAAEPIGEEQIDLESAAATDDGARVEGELKESRALATEAET